MSKGAETATTTTFQQICPENGSYLQILARATSRRRMAPRTQRQMRKSYTTPRIPLQLRSISTSSSSTLHNWRAGEVWRPRMLRWWRLVSVLVMLPVVAAVAQQEATPADKGADRGVFAGETRLNRRVSLATRRIYVGELLERLSKETEV